MLLFRVYLPILQDVFNNFIDWAIFPLVCLMAISLMVKRKVFFIIFEIIESFSALICIQHLIEQSKLGSLKIIILLMKVDLSLFFYFFVLGNMRIYLFMGCADLLFLAAIFYALRRSWLFCLFEVVVEIDFAKHYDIIFILTWLTYRNISLNRI